MVQSIANFFTWVLDLLYSVVPNYGADIIFLTVLLKAILTPLTYHQLRQSFLMTRLQPELQEIMKKYKGDQNKIAQEQQKLYKEHGVNPLLGCFLPLLQIPIFFGLYRALGFNTKFAGVPFLWVPDISKADPTWVTTILMVTITYLQFKATSQPTADPNMKRQQDFMMYMFVLMIAFIARSFPFGVALYWFTFSAFSILEAFVIKKMVHQEIEARNNAKAANSGK